MKILNGLNQNQFAEQVGCGWHKISRLVSTGVLKPIAQLGPQLIFAPDDVAKVKAHLSSVKEAEANQFRPEWDEMTAKERNEFGGSFGAFVAFRKNVVSEHSRGNGKATVVVARVGGAK